MTSAAEGHQLQRGRISYNSFDAKYIKYFKLCKFNVAQCNKNTTFKRYECFLKSSFKKY